LIDERLIDERLIDERLIDERSRFSARGETNTNAPRSRPVDLSSSTSPWALAEREIPQSKEPRLFTPNDTGGGQATLELPRVVLKEQVYLTV
jgi:hypothetical protein